MCEVASQQTGGGYSWVVPAHLKLVVEQGTVVVSCQEMLEPEPFSSALGRDRGAKMPRLLSGALQPIMNNSHQIRRGSEFCLQILKFQKIQSGKKKKKRINLRHGPSSS